MNPADMTWVITAASTIGMTLGAIGLWQLR